jgi:predicted nucleic acid-binding protein
LADPRSVVLDTDVASLIIKGRGDTLAAQLSGRTWCVSYVTVGELVKWGTAQHWGLRRWTTLADWLGRVVVLPYSIEVAYAWGQLAEAGTHPPAVAAAPLPPATPQPKPRAPRSHPRP